MLTRRTLPPPPLRRGWYVLLLGALLSTLPRPVTDNSTRAISATDNVRGHIYEQFRTMFGADEVVVIHIEAPTTVALISTFTASEELLEAFPPIVRVLGPSSAYPDVVHILEDPDLLDQATLDRVHHRLSGPLARSLELLQVTPSAPRATIYGFGKLASPDAWARLKQDIEELTRNLPASVSLTYSGSPFLNLALDVEGTRVDRTSVPLLAILCSLLLYVALRSFRLTLCILLTVGMGVLGADGLYGALGLTGNLVVNVGKPLLFVILLANALHLAVAFTFHLQKGCSRYEAARRAAADKSRGLSLALFTTAVGFASLLAADLAPVRHLGLLTALGLFGGAPLLLYGLPALLAQFGPESMASPENREDHLQRSLNRIVRSGQPYSRQLWIISSLLIAAGFIAGSTLQPRAHPLAFFPASHPIADAYQALEHKGIGLMTLEAMVTQTASVPLPLESLDRWARTSTRADAITGRLDMSLLMRELNWRNHHQDQLPSDAYRSQIRQEAPDLFENLYTDPTHRIAFFLTPRVSATDLVRLTDDLKASFAEDLPDARLQLTGNFALMVTAQLGLQHTLLRSLLLTLVIMELTLWWALRSWRLAAIALIPNILPFAMNILFMKMGNIPLDVGTVMIGAVTLGIAVDDTLHFLVAWKAYGPSHAIRLTGRAIVLSTLVMTCGFFALTPSSFLPTRHFALLTGTAMLVALVGDLWILPALLPKKRSPAQTA